MRLIGELVIVTIVAIVVPLIFYAVSLAAEMILGWDTLFTVCVIISLLIIVVLAPLSINYHRDGKKNVSVEYKPVKKNK